MIVFTTVRRVWRWWSKGNGSGWLVGDVMVAWVFGIGWFLIESVELHIVFK
jgi:hypothetical protein